MMFESLFKELRWSVRNLAKRPFFTLLIVVTLGLGIGANSAIFSFINGILIDALPYPDADRLVRIESLRGEETGRLSLAEIRDLDELPIFEAVSSYRPAIYNLSGGGPPEVVSSAIAGSALFDVLGVPLLHGSSFPADHDVTPARGVVLAHDFWQRRFGGDPNLLDQSITLDASPGYVVHGILPPDFDFLFDVGLFRSAAYFPAQITKRSIRGTYALARLKPGVTYREAQAELDSLATRLERNYPDTNRGLGLRMTSLEELYTGDVRPYLLLLSTAVGLILLIACANVINLLLTRAAGRLQEVALQTALGASRGRILRQGLAESLLLALMGGALGLLLGMWWMRALRALVGSELPVWMTIELDARVLMFTFLISILAGLLAGLVPVLQTWRGDLASVLREGARGTVGHPRLRHGLVIAEVALAFLLLAGAGLMLASFSRLLDSDPGFEDEQILTFRIDLPWKKYPSESEETVVFFDELLARLDALPSVEGAAINNNLPLAGGEVRSASEILLIGQSAEDASRNPFVNQKRVSASYFEVMGIRLERGRLFADTDRGDDRDVAIVSQELAERLWPGRDPLGQQLKVGDLEQEVDWITVVGVVQSVRHDDLAGPPALDVYVPFPQHPTAYQFGVVRSTLPPVTLADAVARVVQAVDPDQAIFDIAPMSERIAAKVWQRRVARTLFGLFGLLASVLAAVGLYGVMSYVIRQRTREIGIRMALGGSPLDALVRALREALVLVAGGITIGLVAAFGLSRLLTRFLYDVAPNDPTVLVLVMALLLVVSLLAGFLPAWRAARISPVVALRD
ncbi:MAG: ABC transporter permease [Acidobacteriota bacterium]